MDRLFILTLLSAFLIGINANASERDSTINQTREIAPVTVTGQRISRTITSGKPVQVIEKDEFEILGITNLADAVKRFAGTTVKDYGGIGGMKTVSVRNLGSHHTAVSYDGVTISNTLISVGTLSTTCSRCLLPLEKTVTYFKRHDISHQQG